MRWWLIWLIQAFISGLLGAIVALLHPLGLIYDLAAWILLPLIGLFAAYRATLRGLNNYLAWIAPPVMAALVHLALWTYLPSPGPILLTALFSIIGAAAGEVRKTRK